MKTNYIHCGDNVEFMRTLPDCCIDLTVTSPPYDDLRMYNGYSFDFEEVAKELYRITKDGGVVVWVVADKTKNGSESGTSFRQALHFLGEGFSLADTMIYHKPDTAFPRHNHKKYPEAFEYMFILSKGMPKTFNRIDDRENKCAGRVLTGTVRQENGNRKPVHSDKEVQIKRFGSRTNIWKYSTGLNKTTKDRYAFAHPAMFPEDLARDHIVSWSNPGDTVFDCFAGAGTTAKMSILNDREYLSCEISEEYVEIANQRIDEAIKQMEAV